MIVLDETKALSVVLGAPVAVSQLELYAAYGDSVLATGRVAGGFSSDAVTTNTTPIILVDVAPTGSWRKVSLVTILNVDSADAEVVVNVGARSMLTVTLKSGYMLTYADGMGWRTVTDKGELLTLASSISSTGFSDPGNLVQWVDVSGKVLGDSGIPVSDIVITTDSRLSDSRTPTAHALLSTAHSDTLAASVVRGDLVVGNSTPKWSRLAVGASGTVLVGGTDPAWSASPTLTSVTLNGTALQIELGGNGSGPSAFVANKLGAQIYYATSAAGAFPFDTNGNLVIQPRTSAADNSGIAFATASGGSTTPSVKLAILSGGNIGIGTVTPNFNSDGGVHVTISGGSANRGNLELATTAADADALICGQLKFSSFNNNSASGDQNIAFIAGYTDGATANKRGGRLYFYTKANNGAQTERLRIDSTGLATFASAIALSGDIQFNTSQAIRRSTSDGSDNGSIFITGGGSYQSDGSRGSSVTVSGNEQSASGNVGPGNVGLQIGNATGAKLWILGGSSATVWISMLGADGSTTFTTSANAGWLFNSTATNGGFFTFQRSGVSKGYLGSALAALGGSFSSDDMAVYALNNLIIYAGAQVKTPTVASNTTASAANVWIDSTDGTLKRSTSSRRYKTAIEPMQEWRWLLGLEPVTFAAKDNPRGRRYGGLIAEDVALSNPLFAVFNSQGQPDEVAYSHLTAPIILALQEHERRLTSLQAQLEGRA